MKIDRLNEERPRDRPSYGPLRPIPESKDGARAFENGEIRGTGRYGIHGSFDTWEFAISKEQLDLAKSNFTFFKQQAKMKYSPSNQCTSMALMQASLIALQLPSGVGTVKAMYGPIPIGKSEYPNPFHLSQQLNSLVGTGTSVNSSNFTTPR